MMKKMQKLISLLFFIPCYVGILFCSSAHSEEYVFVDRWGTQGSGDGQFDIPQGVAIYSSGIYISDTSLNRIQKFDSAGNYITQWGSSGTGNGQFNGPWGIAVDSSDNVYVADSGNFRIQKFDSAGNYITQWGSFGAGNGQFNGPWGVTVDSSDNVYVTDCCYYNRIQKFDSAGNYITQWGSFGAGNGQFNGPWGVAVDSSDNVYVADNQNHRIQKFDSAGNYITQWGSFGSGNGQFVGPKWIVVDSSGNTFVDDNPDCRIQKFNSSGNFITRFSSCGSGDGQFGSGGYGLSVNSTGDVYIADPGNHCIQKFALSQNATSTVPTSTSTTTPTTLAPPEWAPPQLMVIDNSSVRLYWSPSSSQGVIGYRIYYGNASRNYTNQYDAGNVTNYLVTVADPTERSYVALTSYSSTQESDYSAEFSFSPLYSYFTSSTTTAPTSGTTIKLDPSSIVLPAVGNTFTINVKVENVEDLGGFQFDVIYTPSVVTVENNSAVTLGSFLGSTGRTATAVGPSIDNKAGKVTFGGFSFGTPAGPSGSGVLATITLTVQSRASSRLDLANISMLDRDGNALRVATVGSANLTDSAPNTTTTAPGNSTTTSIISNCPDNNPVYCGNGYCCPNNKPYCGSGKWTGRCFVIPRGNICAATFLFGADTNVLNIFRYLRDDILERTPAGRDYGELFYRHSPELIMLFISNPELKALTRDFLNNNLVDMLSVLTGDEITISSAQKDETEYLCDAIKSKASPELQAAIEKFKEDLRTGVVCNMLSITPK
jgi:hypothetical protein